ncbi:MAG: SLC13 family permease, partial [Bacteroidota bacterium]
MERHSFLRIALGPLLGLVAGAWLSSSGQPANLCITAGVAIWMAVWWINEAVSIYATALLPAVLFPLLGVMDMKALAPAYLPQILFLFIGGFMLAFALERWNLHKRIALRVILSVGVSPSRLLLGVMLASYLLSMWITNTATTMLLLPAVLAVAGQTAATDSSEGSRLVTALLLGLAFSASIGGTATIIGTVPNLYFVEFFHEHYPDSATITFPRWMLFGVPVGLV